MSLEPGLSFCRRVFAFGFAATTGDPAAGKKVFQTAGCAGCHTLAAAGAVGQVGPNLDQRKPTFDLVLTRVTNGQGVMPSFRGKLTDQQIGDVAAFVVQATGGTPPVRTPPPPPAASGTVTPKAPVRSWVGVIPTAHGLRATTTRVAAGVVSVRLRNPRPRRLVVAVLGPVSGGATASPVTSRVVRLAPRASRTLALRLRAGQSGVLCRLETASAHPCIRFGAVAPVATPPAGAPAPATAGSPPAPAAPPADGRSLFQSTCGACHTLADAGTTGTAGPNLDRRSPSVQTVRRQVLSGGGGMPSFDGVLTAAEIDLIAEYVARVTNAPRVR